MNDGRKEGWIDGGAGYLFPYLVLVGEWEGG